MNTRKATMLNTMGLNKKATVKSVTTPGETHGHGHGPAKETHGHGHGPAKETHGHGHAHGEDEKLKSAV